MLLPLEVGWWCCRLSFCIFDLWTLARSMIQSEPQMCCCAAFFCRVPNLGHQSFTQHASFQSWAPVFDPTWWYVMSCYVMPCHADSHHFLEGRSVLLLYWSFPCRSSSSCFSPQHLMSKPAKEEDQQPVQERGHWSKKVRRPSFQGKPNRVALSVLYCMQNFRPWLETTVRLRIWRLWAPLLCTSSTGCPRRSVNVSLRTLRRGTMEMLQGPRPLTSNRRKIMMMLWKARTYCTWSPDQWTFWRWPSLGWFFVLYCTVLAVPFPSHWSCGKGEQGYSPSTPLFHRLFRCQHTRLQYWKWFCTTTVPYCGRAFP